MNQKVVSYETAMALKAKGFNEPTEFCYWRRKTGLHMIAPHLTNERLGEGKCSAPKMDEVRQWLFNKHKILIEIPLVAKLVKDEIIEHWEYYYTFGFVNLRGAEPVGQFKYTSATRFFCWDNALTAAINYIVEKEI